jgi:hypothetical protein
MTLLELLVKGLSCAWSLEADGAVQDKHGQIWFYKSGKPYYTGIIWAADPKSIAFDWVHCGPLLARSDDYATAIVTREQYEAAIAAQQPVWNGEGLPPVGSDVEFTLDTDKYSVQGNIPENGQVVNVVAHKQTTDGNPVAVVYWDERGSGRAAAFIKAAFSPLRTEAERKREAEVDELIDAITLTLTDIYASQRFMDAIESGKIPGVELTK